jgi:hypothetical protein
LISFGSPWPGIRLTTVVVIDFDFLCHAMTRNQAHNCCGDRFWFPLKEIKVYHYNSCDWFLVMASQRKSKSITTTVVSLIPGHGKPKEIKIYHHNSGSQLLWW